MSFFLEFTSTDQFHAAAVEKAQQLGLQIGFVAPATKNDWSEDCAIAGSTFAVKDALKANGARWNGAVKAWTFNNYAALENALAAIEVK